MIITTSHVNLLFIFGLRKRVYNVYKVYVPRYHYQVYQVMTYFILGPAKFTVKDRGCWRDTYDRALLPMEMRNPALMSNYIERTYAYDKCLRAALVSG